MIHLLPVEGKPVPDPDTKKIVGSEGVKMKVLSTYWFRRVKDGSMVHASEVKAEVANKDKKQNKDKE